MSWATELGVVAVHPAAGATLRLLAAAARAKTIIEIGTGTGVSSLWLLGGMRADGLLTSIDIESEHQAMARQSFAAAGFAASRTRLIAGAARDVLPRIADAAYDLLFVDGDPTDFPYCVEAAGRIVREGGLIVLHNVLADGLDPDDAAALQRAVRAVHAEPQWTTQTVLPTGAGLLCATRAS